MRIIISLFLLIWAQCSSAVPINVYLRFDDPKLYQAVEGFNAFLESKSVLTRYQIEPFLRKHPLHTTLYLASYPDVHLKEIKRRVKRIAKQWAPIQLKTGLLSITPGNFVMLDVDLTKYASGQNHSLQQLSDVMVSQLSNLRNFKALPPDWVQSFPGKKKAFLNYGSPNVFFEFTPHFSLMAKYFADTEEQTRFQNELTELIKEYSMDEINTESALIGIGYVDKFGQVTKEIAAYPLLGMMM